MKNFDPVINLINQILVVVIFLVIGGFLWFIFAVSGAFLGIHLGYQQWVRLWLPLFQPALGIIMAGALINGIWSWVQRQRNQD